jgi:hypothetical protein
VRFRSALLALGIAALGAAPPSATLNVDAVPAGPRTAVMTRYLEAVRAKAYPAAFALLDPTQRAYYRTADNFATVFTADNLALQSFRIFGTHHDARGYAYFVEEKVSFRDPLTQATQTKSLSTVYGVFAAGGGTFAVRDATHPWRQVAPAASASASDLTVTLQRLAFYERRIEAVVTFTNTGDAPVTLLPYGKTVLSEAAGDTFRPIDTKDWRLTDKQLFLGARLGPHARYTGVLNFQTARLSDAPRTFTLTVGPALREGADAPFSVTLPSVKG